MNEEHLETAVSLLKKSRSTVALTGAGISTPSGIPDFRSPSSGLWSKVDPMDIATIDSFMQHPKRFFDFILPLTNMFSEARPNAAHTALADLENMGLLKCVVTQNIDNLHQRAGSRAVTELHGNADRAFCLKCRKPHQFAELRDLLSDGVPRCACGGIIKPDVILFGESLPAQALSRAMEDSRECDLMIVLGSSLIVTPASFLPQIAFQAGARVIIINIQPTYIDDNAAVVFHDQLEIVLPEIVRRLNRAS